MKSVFVITMWSGGKPAKKWTSDAPPALLDQGNGVSFIARETKLPVKIIGPISVEEYESGKEELEAGLLASRSEDGQTMKVPRHNISGEPFHG